MPLSARGHEGVHPLVQKPRHLLGIAASAMLSCFVGGAHLEPKHLLVPGQASLKNCPFSSGRGDVNPGPLGPKNCRIPQKRRFQSGFPDLNYMKCIEFHRPGTIWAHSPEDQSQRTYLHGARFAGRSPPGVYRCRLTNIQFRWFVQKLRAK